ncbi:uronyl 2-sulfotransferase-like [Amphiura filiformis]|uniref:uronyl 2-sulfotransferase-like n=1 Tax=Amphiura filiformis TaxID=82378 RepID=UPI003B216C88
MYMSLFVFRAKTTNISYQPPPKNIRGSTTLAYTTCTNIDQQPLIGGHSPTTHLRPIHKISYQFQPAAFDPKSRWILYNRMTKSGSRTFVSTLLKTMNKYHNNISHQDVPFIVIGHHLHVNYTKYGLRQPMGLGLIRDPVERFISEFYYQRYGDKHTPANFKNMSMDIYNRTIEECVDMATHQRKRATPPGAGIAHFCGCQLNHEIHRFCGYEKRCTQDPDFALHQAKVNLNEYIAVGLTEELPEFFKVLEKLLPGLFKGLLGVYNESRAGQNNTRDTKTFLKRYPSNKYLAKLRALAFREYDFYYFVRERFHYQQKQVTLGL